MPRRLLLALLTFTALLLSTAGPAGAQEDSGGEGEEIGHEEEECIEILEGGGTVDECQEAPSPILPELNEIIWGSLAFLVILGALAKFGLPAIKKGMEARSEKIRSSLAEAEGARSEAQAVLTDYQSKLADARNESSRIIEEARGQADTVRRDLIARAEADASELRQRNTESIAVERDRIMSEVQGQVGVLAIELAEKVVESNLDREANLRLIESYINTVGRNGAPAPS